MIKGNTKKNRIEYDSSYLDDYKIRRHDNKNLTSCIININDIVVKVRLQIGDEVEEDTLVVTWHLLCWPWIVLENLI